jgi:hypothetical protein
MSPSELAQRIIDAETRFDLETGDWIDIERANREK